MKKHLTPILTQQELKQFLSYDPDTGIFIWRVKLSNRNLLGKQAGYLNTAGYRQIAIKKKLYSSHRLAWFYMTGCFPIDEIDHKNGVKDDNRFSNLRQASRSFNMQNQRKATKQSKTGALGVSIDYLGRPRAQIRLNYKTIRLGTFDTIEEAAAVYLKAKRRLHPGCLI